MLELAGSTTVYLACGVTDLRKSYHGLAAIIKLKFQLDPYSRCMFAFCNRRRTSIKILQWDGSGFWILMKRLDKNCFRWPDTPDELQKVTLKEIIPDTPGGVRRAASENHRVGSCFVNPQKDEKSRDIRLISYNCRLHFSSKKAGLYGILLVEKRSRENTRWSRFLQKIS